MRYSPPIADGRTIVNKKDAFNNDIISVLESNFSRGKEQSKTFALNFVGANDEQTANNVWNYLRHKIKYKRDSDKRQQIRLPARLVADAATGADCKSFALFACSILANLGFKVGFRYASYSGSSTPTHVYCIATKKGRQYIVDGVWGQFNHEKSFTNKTDHIMQVETLSGFNPGRKMAPVNPNDPKQLQAFYNKLPNKNGILAKLVMKKLSPSGARLNYTPFQIKHYKDLLIKSLSHYKNPSSIAYQLLQDELTRVNSGTVTGAIFGVPSVLNGIAGKGKAKKFFKKVGKAVKKAGKAVEKVVKKASLAAPRTAFLQLVKLNVFALADRLNRGKVSNPSQYEKFWKNLGGSVSALNSAVNTGKGKRFLGLAKKKKISGIAGIGDPATVATVIALATPIMIIAAKLFKKAPGEPDINTGDVSSLTDALESAGVSPELVDTVKDLAVQAYSTGGGHIDTSDYANDPEQDTKATGIDFGGYMPWLIGGGAVLYFATRK